MSTMGVYIIIQLGLYIIIQLLLSYNSFDIVIYDSYMIHNQSVSKYMRSYMIIQLFIFGHVIYDSEIIHQRLEWNCYENITNV